MTRLRAYYTLLGASIVLAVLNFSLLRAVTALTRQVSASLEVSDTTAASVLLGHASALSAVCTVLAWVCVALGMIAAVVGWPVITGRERLSAPHQDLSTIKLAVEKMAALAVEAESMEVKRKRLAEQKDEIEALLATSAQERAAVVKYSGSQRWAVISIVVSTVVAVTLWSYSEFL